MDAPAESRRHRPCPGVREALAGVALAALSASLYLGALHNPFVYDDRLTVVDNGSIRHLGNMHVVLLFDRFRPLVNLSFAVDYAFWGLNPAGFRLTNVGLHALNVVLVFALLSRIVGDCRTSMDAAWGISPGASRLIPLIASALFAVHPMMTEAVGYISGRSDVLAGTFFLLTFLLMRKGLVSGRPRWIALALVPLILGLASKEVSAMLPFVLLAYDRLVLRRRGLEGRRRLLRFHLPLIGGVILIGLTRLLIFVNVEHGLASEALGRAVGYVCLQFEAVWKYVQLLMLPFHRSIAHNVTGSTSLAVLGAVSLVITCLLAFRVRERGPLLSFGVAWFLLLMVPSSSVVPLQSPMAEHRVYLASIGLFLAVSSFFARLAEGLRDRPVGRRILYAAGVLVVAALATMTVARNAVWSDPVALWREATFTAPRWDTYTGLGHALRDAGDCG